MASDNPYYVAPQGGYNIGRGLYGLAGDIEAEREEEDRKERLKRMSAQGAEEAYGQAFEASPEFLPEQQPTQQQPMGGGMGGIGGLSSLWSGGGAAGAGEGAGAAAGGGAAAGAGGGASAGGGAAAGSGSAAGSGGSAMASAGPWALLAAVIIGNEYNARKQGARAENPWHQTRDAVTGRVVEQDFHKRWLPKWFGEDRGGGDYEKDVTGFGADTHALADFTTFDPKNAWKTIWHEGSARKLFDKIF